MNNHVDMVNPLNLVEELLWGNEQDALMENIWDYNTFDVIRYYIDTHVYFFTRPAFSTLATKKKNFLINKSLPIPVISEVIGRIETALVCTLPPPAPLQELLERVEKGTLYNPAGNQVQPQPVQPQPVQPPAGAEMLTPSDIRGVNNRPARNRGRTNNLRQAGVSISVPIAQLPPLPDVPSFPQLERSAIRHPPRNQSAMDQGRTNMVNLLSATHLREELPDILEMLAGTMFDMSNPSNPPHRPQPPRVQASLHFLDNMVDIQQGTSPNNSLFNAGSGQTIVGNLFDSTDEDMDLYEEEEESVDSLSSHDT